MVVHVIRAPKSPLCVNIRDLSRPAALVHRKLCRHTGSHAQLGLATSELAVLQATDHYVRHESA